MSPRIFAARTILVVVLAVLPTLGVLAPLVESACLAGTFHLAPDGSDTSGDGSRERPWRTIRHASNAVPDDGSTIVLGDGLYVGAQAIDRQFDKILTIRAENPYRARLRSPDDSNRVLTIFRGRNVVFEGLEMFGSGASRVDYLIQISTANTERIALIDCIIHDSYKNDLIKINSSAKHIVLRGCLLFNQNDNPGDEHLDINTVTDVTIEDCILLNDFQGSGRPVGNKSHSFIVIKNSGSTPDVTRRITLRRNVFLNYQGKVDQCYVLLGEDGKPFVEAQQILIENNLFLHHSPVRFWGTLLLKGGLKDIAFRANTVVGHPHIQWSGAYAAVCFRVGDNPPMENLRFANNIWCDASGQMPRLSMSRAEVFAEGSPPVLNNNLYFNAGKPIPSEPNDVMVPAADPRGIHADPRLGNPNDALVLPRWNAEKRAFLSGETSNRGEFERLVRLYAVPGDGSAARGRADPSAMPKDDILGNPRGPKPTIGCFEPPAGRGR